MSLKRCIGVGEGWRGQGTIVERSQQRGRVCGCTAFRSQSPGFSRARLEPIGAIAPLRARRAWPSGCGSGDPASQSAITAVCRRRRRRERARRRRYRAPSPTPAASAAGPPALTCHAAQRLLASKDSATLLNVTFTSMAGSARWTAAAKMACAWCAVAQGCAARRAILRAVVCVGARPTGDSHQVGGRGTRLQARLPPAVPPAVLCHCKFA
jgi:hypothetical protein